MRGARVDEDDDDEGTETVEDGNRELDSVAEETPSCEEGDSTVPSAGELLEFLSSGLVGSCDCCSMASLLFLICSSLGDILF